MPVKSTKNKEKKVTEKGMESSLPTGRVGKYYHAIGKRKTSVAVVRLYEGGNGNISINGKTAEEFTNSRDLVEIITAPLRLTGGLKNYDITIKVDGGGFRGQVDAIKHAISRALTGANSELRASIKKVGYLTRDSRIKERKKPGLKRARRAPQWSKR